jgi:hypothetical protein
MEELQHVGKSAYIQEAERQLSDDRFYNKSDKDPTRQFSDEITNELNNMYVLRFFQWDDR